MRSFKTKKVYPEFEKWVVIEKPYRKVIISTNVRIKRGKKHYLIAVTASAFVSEAAPDAFTDTEISNMVDLFKRFMYMCEEIKYLHSTPSKQSLKDYPDIYSKDNSHLTNKEEFLLKHPGK